MDFLCRRGMTAIKDETYGTFALLSLKAQDEGIVVGLIAIGGVLGQGALTPGIDTTHTVDIEVDIEIDKTTTLDVLGVTGSGIKVLLAIIPCTDAEGLETNYS